MLLRLPADSGRRHEIPYTYAFKYFSPCRLLYRMGEEAFLVNVELVIQKTSRTVLHPCLLMPALINTVSAYLFLRHCEVQQGLVM